MPISLIQADKKGEPKKKIGVFKSYRDIGEWLSRHGETGKYYAIPKNIRNIGGIRVINVEKYRREEDGKWDRIIEMEGSCY